MCVFFFPVNTGSCHVAQAGFKPSIHPLNCDHPVSSLPQPLRMGITDVHCHSHYLFCIVMNGKCVNSICILLHSRMNSSEHFLIWKCFVFLMEIKINRS